MYYKHESVGPQVTRIQRKLNEFGYYTATCDGNYTKATAHAVKEFQREKKLNVDGEVGPSTWAELFPREDYVDPALQTGQIQDHPIPIWGNRYITLAGLLSFLLWVILATYEAVEHVDVQPLQNENAQVRRTVEALTTDNDRLTKQYASLRESMRRPELSGPVNDASLIGNQVELSWDYKGHYDGLEYILELRNLTTKGEPCVFNVPTSRLKKMFYIIPPGGSNSEYLWRVRPGKLEETSSNQVTQVSEGQWSAFGNFRIYSSNEDRIRRTGRVLVGVSPTSYGLLSSLDQNGRVVGFDRNLMNLIGDELSKRYKEQIKVEVVDKDWDQLLPSLASNEIDLVIASMTATKERASKNHISFSNGYFQLHQILIAKQGIRPIDRQHLSKKIVGVQEGTTNERAAEYLSKSLWLPYKFTINSQFSTVDEVYQALMRNEIDVALVDDVAVLRHFEEDESLCEVGGDIDEDLVGFYRTELGKETEEYAVGVSDNGLLQQINEIIEKSADKIAGFKSGLPNPRRTACGANGVSADSPPIEASYHK